MKRKKKSKVTPRLGAPTNLRHGGFHGGRRREPSDREERIEILDEFPEEDKREGDR